MNDSSSSHRYFSTHEAAAFTGSSDQLESGRARAWQLPSQAILPMLSQATSNTSKINMTLTNQGLHRHPLLEVDENATTLGKHMNSGEVQIRRWAASSQVVEHTPGRLVYKHSRSQDMQDPPTDQTQPHLAWAGPLATDNHLLLLADTSLLTQPTLHMEHPLCNQVWPVLLRA